MVSDMTNEEIVKALREHVEWWDLTNEWETPITLGDDLSAAADLIENQQNHIRALLQANDALRPAWIPVTERLPDNGQRVLAYCKDRVIHDAKWSWPQNEWLDKVTGNSYFESFVTHWMPLPPTPEED